MKKTSKRIVTFLLAAVLLLGGTVGAVAATSDTIQYPPIVTRIAERFGLDPAKVNAVFKEERQERETQRQKQSLERLDQAVKDGELTENQKEAIIAKRKELEQKRQEMMDQNQDQTLTRKQMQEQRRAEMDELKKWAEEQDIDMRWLMLMGGRNGRHGPGGGCGPGGFGPPPDRTNIDGTAATPQSSDGAVAPTATQTSQI